MAENLPLEPPRRVTVVDSIIEQLVSLIQQGALKPGDRLPSERQLMERLGVSRSSVREALQGLAAMGLVEGCVGQGTFVRASRLQFSPDLDITTLSTYLQREMRHHLNQARLFLESDTVTLAAQKINASSRAMLLKALEDYEAHRGTASEEKRWPAHDRMHLAIAEATGNPILVRVLQTLLDLVPKSLRDRGLLLGSSEQVAGRVEAERAYHRQLCEAIARGDAPAALAWMERHAEAESQLIDEYYGSIAEEAEKPREGGGKQR